MLDRYPQLYRLGQKNYFFSSKAFWMWTANAIYHSLVSRFSSFRWGKEEKVATLTNVLSIDSFSSSYQYWSSGEDSSPMTVEMEVIGSGGRRFTLPSS
jgi:hypothetical protein